MKHPAFYTDTDAASRRNASAQQTQIAKAQAAVAQKETQEQLYAQPNSSNQASLSAESQPLSSSYAATTEESASQMSSVANSTATQPVVSSEVQAKLQNAKDAISAQMSSANEMLDASKLVNELNATLSSLCAPLYSMIDMLKSLPPKLRSVVDIQGAANGMYSSLMNLADTFNCISTSYVSSEVPISLDDYKASPTSYPMLESMQKINNSITDGDCLSSGYTKIVMVPQTQIVAEPVTKFFNPEDQDTVAKKCEMLFNATVKNAWSVMQPPIQMVAGIANIGPIGEMVNSVVQLVDGIAQFASAPVPEEKLGQKIKERELGGQELASEAEKAQGMANYAKAPEQDAVEASKNMAKDIKTSLDQQKDIVMKSAADAFAKMKMPPMVDGLDETLEDIWKSVQMVASNISNVFIVVLFKLLEAVFKCFNQIASKIGVPTLPYPLNILPQLIMNVIDIMTFVLGLPMSLYNQAKAIVKRKMKAMVVDSMPTPPKPVPEVIPIAPTSDDVPKVDATWQDVKQALNAKWGFDDGDATSITNSLQEFYVDSNQYVDVLEGKVEVESDYEGHSDVHPVYNKELQYLLSPQAALEEWIPSHFGGRDAPLRVPQKHIAQKEEFYAWQLDASTGKWHKRALDVSFSWEYGEYMPR